MKNKIIAVDFDGTLCKNKWPEIGEANKEMITYLKDRQANGYKLILWTCRVDDMLKNAISWSAEQGLVFDAVNENLPEIVASFGTDTRKIFANEYIDDRNAWLPSKEVADILYLCDGKQCGDSCPSAECKHTSDISHAKNFVKEITILTGKRGTAMNRSRFIQGLKSDIQLSEKERRRIIRNSIKKYPWKLKCTVAMEEFAELQQQVSKQIRGYGDKLGLLEEIADAYICLSFLESIFDVKPEDLQKAIDVKLQRERENCR